MRLAEPLAEAHTVPQPNDIEANKPLHCTTKLAAEMIKTKLAVKILLILF
jgi:hypothetical protein